MVTEWPRQHAQTKAAMKKIRPLEEKVLAEVRKRIKHNEKILDPAVEKSKLTYNTTMEAKQMAENVAQVRVWLLSSSPIKPPF